MSSGDGLESAVKGLLEEGRKIEAIKLCREHTGAGLAEAKAAVEAFEQGEPLPARRAAGSDVEWDLVSLLEQGRKLEAIKLYREQTGSGLKEAKDAVERTAAERGIATGGGCLGLVVFVVVAGYALGRRWL